MRALSTDPMEGQEFSIAKKDINVGNAERWASMVGGTFLTLFGMTRKTLPGKALSLAGGYLFYRGTTGYDPLYKAMGVNTNIMSTGVNIDRTIIINRSPDEVYRFWHNFENLPRFMEHLESVKVLGAGRSHWVASVPGGLSFEWDAETVEDLPNQFISWRSLANAEVDNQGSVEFRSVPEGCELRFKASYFIPGAVGAAGSKLFQYISEKQLQKELEQFKTIIESGSMLRAA